MHEELAYYKSQYETLEVELQEFQASSKELEAELERDVEESEKRERKLQEKAEQLKFEVEEWKASSVRHGCAGVVIALGHRLTRDRRQSTSKAKPRPITRRIRSKRRLLACATHNGPSNSSCETSKCRATTLSARPATRRHR